MMLVFDEAIRRTDDLAHVGGVGDTIEIDLVDTRFQDVSETGNNPIFHTAEPRSANSGLSADGAFGLTFDIGPNPKVTQTAIIVRPTNSGGRWVMAMARTRRLILPETELGTILRGDPTLALPPNVAVIPTRLEGRDVVPCDFVVDSDNCVTGPFVLVSSVGGPSRTIGVPPAVTGHSNYRYLVTWHKARWGNIADSTWRCEVKLLAQSGGGLAWDTLLGTVRGFQNITSELMPDAFVDRWYLAPLAAGVHAQIRRIRISDYSSPKWLTFIGSFGSAVPGMPSDYRFVLGAGEKGRLGTLKLASESKASLPKLRNRSATFVPGGEPTFHLALIFCAVDDAVRMRTEDGTGELVACYFVDSNQESVYLPRTVGDAEPESLKGCFAHIVTLQRITSLSDVEKKAIERARSLEDLLKCAFPNQGATAKESTLRIVPEYLGPVPIIG